MRFACSRILAQNVLLTAQLQIARAQIECLRAHRRYSVWSPVKPTKAARRFLARQGV